MKIAKGIEMLELPSNIMGKQDVIYPTLIWDESNALLIDAGLPGQLNELKDAVQKSGADFNGLSHIIITHHDIDHMGSLLPLIEALSGKAETLAHSEESPYISGERTPVKLARLEANLASLSEEMKPIYNAFKNFYGKNKLEVSTTLRDGDELPFCGGITVVYTPGHSPGHICLYHKQSKTMICGDALGTSEGKLIKTSAHANLDNDLATKSLQRLLQYDIENLICYHGGLFRGNVHEALEALINE